MQVGDGSAEAGMTMLREAYEQAKARRDVDEQLTALLALGDAHGFLEHPTEARMSYADGLHLAEAEHRLPFEAKLRLRLAQIHNADGQLDEGITLGKRAPAVANRP